MTRHISFMLYSPSHLPRVKWLERSTLVKDLSGFRWRWLILGNLGWCRRLLGWVWGVCRWGILGGIEREVWLGYFYFSLMSNWPIITRPKKFRLVTLWRWRLVTSVINTEMASVLSNLCYFQEPVKPARLAMYEHSTKHEHIAIFEIGA